MGEGPGDVSLDELWPVLAGRLADVGGHRARPPAGPEVIVVPPKVPEFGEIVVRPDADTGVIVEVGFFTHLHFDFDAEALRADRHAEVTRVAEEVARFLREVVEDRIEFWGGLGRSGGCRRRGVISSRFGALLRRWLGPGERDELWGWSGRLK